MPLHHHLSLHPSLLLNLAPSTTTNQLNLQLASRELTFLLGRFFKFKKDCFGGGVCGQLILEMEHLLFSLQ